MSEPAGRVLWITGLSGAGKTTIAREVVARLRGAGLPALLLDGDAVRDAIRDPGTGHDRAARLVNAYRICRLARMLAAQDLVVVVATMSLFHEIHAWNRENLPGYFEVFLDADHATREARDPKGLYARAREGSEGHVAGVDLDFEPPEHPDLRLANDEGHERVVELVERILEAFRKRFRAPGIPKSRSTIYPDTDEAAPI